MDEKSIAAHYSTSKAWEAGDWNTTSMMAAAAAAAASAAVTSAAETMDDPSNIVGKTGAVIIVLIIIVGVTGNSQVLIVIAKCPQLHRSFNIFIASLSLTDLVYTVLMLPFYADTYIHRTLRYPVTLCRVLTHSGGCLVVASGLHLGLIAINRYVLIVHPHLYGRISSGMAIAVQLFIIWMASFFTVLPGIFGWQAVVGYSDQVGRCNYLRSESRITLSLIFCVGFLFPCSVMAYCYILIWKTLMTSRKKMKSHQHAASKTDCILISERPANAITRSSIAPERNRTGSCISSSTDGEPASRSIDSSHDIVGDVQFKSKCKRPSICNLKIRLNRKYNKRQVASESNCGRSIADVQLNTGNDDVNKEHKKESLLPKGDTTMVDVRMSVTSSVDGLLLKVNNSYCDVNTERSFVSDVAGECTASSNPVDEAGKTDASSSLNSIVDHDIYASRMVNDNSYNMETARGSCDLRSPFDSRCSGAVVPHTRKKSTLGRSRMRSVRMIMMVFVAFALTYLPFTLINLGDERSQLHRSWYMSTSLAFWSGSCVNPIIYGIMNKQFRSAYFTVLPPLYKR